MGFHDKERLENAKYRGLLRYLAYTSTLHELTLVTPRTPASTLGAFASLVWVVFPVLIFRGYYPVLQQQSDRSRVTKGADFHQHPSKPAHNPQFAGLIANKPGPAERIENRESTAKIQ